ncbi:UNVERIFIED_CONTAM: hypothetical protein RF649_13925 [Kocuria sp. CPCC 205295]
MATFRQADRRLSSAPSSRRTPMTAALRPYLNFPGNAREAFEF